MTESPYLNLPETTAERLHGVPIGGQWRLRSGILEGARFGGAWHPIKKAERGPKDVILCNGMILVPEG